MKRVSSLITLLIGISCFSQQPKLMAEIIDKACHDYVIETFPCAGYGWGPDVGFVELSSFYSNDNGTVTENCLLSYKKEENKILKVVFSCGGFIKKRSLIMETEFYYQKGKPFYVKVRTKKFRRNKKIYEKVHEFEFKNTLPDDIDSDTKNWLENKIKELL